MRPHQPASTNGAPKEFTAYSDLLDRAHGEGLKAIATQLLAQPNDENGRLAIVKAIVETEKGRFEGLGDADPTSVEAFLVPHLIRVAETRAKARALRDAVNCGVVSFEEVDGFDPDTTSPRPGPGAPTPAARPRRTPPRRGNGAAPSRAPAHTPNGAGTANGQDGPMSESQRRYLFRLLAGKGYQGKDAEEYLYAELDVRSLSQVTRTRASELIDELLNAAPAREPGGGATALQR